MSQIHPSFVLTPALASSLGLCLLHTNIYKYSRLPCTSRSLLLISHALISAHSLLSPLLSSPFVAAIAAPVPSPCGSFHSDLDSIFPLILFVPLIFRYVSLDPSVGSVVIHTDVLSCVLGPLRQPPMFSNALFHSVLLSRTRPDQWQQLKPEYPSISSCSSISTQLTWYSAMNS